MRHRLTFILAVITAAALAAGAAWAAIPASVDSESIIEVSDAGTVTVVQSGSDLTIAAVDVADGWVYEIEVATGPEVEADFRNGPRRVQFNAELEDGLVRARVRERVQATEQTSTTGGSTQTTQDDRTSVDDNTSTTLESSTSTSVDDTTSTTIDDSTSTTMGDTTSTTVDDSTSTSTHDDDTTSTTIDDHTSTTVDDGGVDDDHGADDGGVDDDQGVGDDQGPSGSGAETYSVGGVGTVAIAWSNGQMSLVSVSVADGWKIEKQEVRSDRIKIEFESDDDDDDARFEADFHDGTIRVEARVG